MNDLVDAVLNQSSCGGLSEEFGEISVQVVDQTSDFDFEGDDAAILFLDALTDIEKQVSCFDGLLIGLSNESGLSTVNGIDSLVQIYDCSFSGLTEVLSLLLKGRTDLPVDQGVVWEFFVDSGVVSVCRAGPCSPGVVVDGLEFRDEELGDVLVFVEAGPETSLKQVEGIRAGLESRYSPASVISTGKVSDLQGEQCRITVFTA